MKRRSSVFLEFLSVVTSLAILASFFLLVHLLTPGSFEKKWIEIEIPAGSSFTRGVTILEDRGIISSRLGLLAIGRITRSDRSLKAGFYNLSSSLSPLQVFDILMEGRTVSYSITIPEGSSLHTIREKLKNIDVVDDESWQLVHDDEFLADLNIQAPSLEGYLYPDTYNFAKGTHPRVIFRMMTQRMRESFNESMIARAEEMGMTENEILTIASIIEKEAIYDRERPLISAVYHNRLKKKMRLQADPTVLYGVRQEPRRIRYRDLRRATPYNTYIIRGLPPGPIASPGIKSIRAALHPADVDYMFFVAKNDGTHHFSKTGREHMRAVVQYQRGGREFAGREGTEEN